MPFKNIFLYPTEALNELHSNVWAIVIMVGGIILTLKGHNDVGGALITGSFALIRISTTTQTVPTQPSTKEE